MMIDDEGKYFFSHELRIPYSEVGQMTEVVDYVAAEFECLVKEIPAGWSVSAPDAYRRHFLRLTLHSLMRFSTLKFQGSNMHDIAAIFTMQPKNNSSLRTRTAR